VLTFIIALTQNKAPLRKNNESGNFLLYHNQGYQMNGFAGAPRLVKFALPSFLFSVLLYFSLQI